MAINKIDIFTVNTNEYDYMSYLVAACHNTDTKQ